MALIAYSDIERGVRVQRHTRIEVRQVGDLEHDDTRLVTVVEDEAGAVTVYVSGAVVLRTGEAPSEGVG